MLDRSHVLQNNSPHVEMCSSRFRLFSFGCIKLTSRASYSARALACQIEARSGSQMNRVRIPAVRCVTAAGFAFYCLNSPYYFIHQNGVHYLLAQSNAEGIANTLPPMSLNVKCNLCFTRAVIKAVIDYTATQKKVEVRTLLDFLAFLAKI